MNTKLIISCIGGTGALGGVAGGCYYLLNNKENTNKSSQQDQPSKADSKVPAAKQTLKEALKGENFEALDLDGDTDKENWKKLIAKYNDGVTTPKINVTETIKKEPTDDDNAANIKILQKTCKTLLDKTDIATGDKEIAKNWCNKNSTLIKGAEA